MGDRVTTFSVEILDGNIAQAMRDLDAQVAGLGTLVIKNLMTQRFENWMTRTVVYIPAAPARRRAGIQG
jgi:hypothetical protein